MSVSDSGWLVFHADDLGLAFGFNEAIRAAHLGGNVTSTCLQTAGIAYRHALEEVLPECPQLGVGVHVNLVECRSILAPGVIPDLVDADGVFRGYRPLLAATWNRRIRQQVRDEARAQIDLALEDGVVVDHLNSHRHAHMLPGLFETFCELAAAFSIPFIRLLGERFHRPRPLSGGAYYLHEANWAKMGLMNALARRNRRRLSQFDLCCNDAFVGLSYTGRGTERALMAALEANTPPRDGPSGARDCTSLTRKNASRTRGDATERLVIEALVHLARSGDPRDGALPPGVAAYCNDPARSAEQAAAESVELRRWIEDRGLRLTNYGALAARRGPVSVPRWPTVRVA